MYLKKITMLFISLAMVLSCSNNKSGSTASLDSVNYLSGGEGDWVVKIDNLTINKSIFDSDLTASMKYQGANDEQISLAKNDNATKQYYSEVLIRDVLLL